MKKWIAALVALLLLVVACDQSGMFALRDPKPQGEKDWCGYTWDKVGPRADIIFIHYVDSWEGIPKQCNPHSGMAGCADSYVMGGKNVTDIWINKFMEQSGVCDTYWHELGHAAGLRHREAHGYIPGRVK